MSMKIFFLWKSDLAEAKYFTYLEAVVFNRNPLSLSV